MQLEVSGIDHVYVSVTDLARSMAFYDPVMRLLGFRKGTNGPNRYGPDPLVTS